MLIVNSICGNVFQSNRLAEKLELAKSNGTLRRLLLSRIEMVLELTAAISLLVNINKAN